MIGYLKDLTHGTATGMYVLAGMLVIGSIAGVAHARETGRTLRARGSIEDLYRGRTSQGVADAMPRFAANLTMMYTEHAFLDRFAAAAKTALRAVEFLFPGDFARRGTSRRGSKRTASAGAVQRAARRH